MVKKDESVMVYQKLIKITPPYYFMTKKIIDIKLTALLNYLNVSCKPN